MKGAAKVVDTTLYPDSDFMGENELHRLMTELLRPLLAAFLARSGRVAHVGANQFIYYQQFNTAKRTAPDIYVFSDVPQDIAPPSYKLWEMSAPPSFALEIVSRDLNKDYDTMPPVHAEIGTRELVIFDPEARPTTRGRARHTFQVHRRQKGGLYLVEATSANRAYSKELGCWFRTTGTGAARRLRVASGPRGDEIFPTDAEAERAEKDRERAARLAAEAEVAELRARLVARKKR